jgi:transglutaminase-like putative cysteine protease
MLLEIAHRTAYRYELPVRHSKNEVRAVPVSDAHQRCLDAGLEVTPAATFPLRWRDYFGTEVVAFDIDGPHDGVEVVASATVSSLGRSAETLLDGWTGDADQEGAGLDELDATEFLLPSPLVELDGQARELAGRLGAPGGALAMLERVLDWVRGELRYERGSTTVRTSVAEVLARRRGVCQDFAHVTCALLRASRVPARYVSGYFTPDPLEVGDEAHVEGHAWVEAWLPGLGWWALDPTNDQAAGERHVKVGHGRDYRDVAPVRGVYRGGTGGRLEVDVRIRRLPDEDGEAA